MGGVSIAMIEKLPEGTTCYNLALNISNQIFAPTGTSSSQCQQALSFRPTKATWQIHDRMKQNTFELGRVWL
jgi:hypothetical protein